MLDRNLMRQAFEAAMHHKALGARYLDHGADWVLLELPFSDHLVAYPETGVIAGGAVYTIMDSASGFAIIAGASVWAPLATLDLRIEYLKPVPPRTNLLVRGEVYRRTRTIMFSRAIAYIDDIEKPVAMSTGTFIVGAA
jgi:uncharacterized protein (TIGR00369 family)